MRSKRPLVRAEKAFFATSAALIAGALLFWKLSANRPIHIELADSTKIRGLVFSPDGTRLLILVFDDNRVEATSSIHDVKSGALLSQLQSPSPEANYFYPSWSPDGKSIAAGIYDGVHGKTKVKWKAGWKANSGGEFNDIGKVAVWDSRSGQLRNKWLYGSPDENSFADVFFTPDGRNLFGFGVPPMLFDANSGLLLKRYLPRGISDKDKFAKAVLNRQSSLIAINHYEKNRFEIVDNRTGSVIWNPPSDLKVSRGIDSMFHSRMAWSWDNVFVWTYSTFKERNRLLMWDAKGRKLLQAPPIDGIGHIALNPRSPLVALSRSIFSQDGAQSRKDEIIVWNYRTRRVLWRSPRQQEVWAIQWSPNGQRLLLLEAPREGRNLFCIFDKNGTIQYDSLEKNCRAVAWSPDSKTVATAVEDHVEIRHID